MVGPAKGKNLHSKTGYHSLWDLQVRVHQTHITLDLQMSNRQPSLPSKLRIWQQNGHKANMPQEYIRTTAKPEDWDVIALQEPWLDSFNNSRANSYWRVIYLVNHLVDNQDYTCSILLVNTNISSDCYTVFSIQHSDITVIQFKGDYGNLSIFNIYV